MILFCDKDYCKFSWPEGPRVIMKSKVMTIVIMSSQLVSNVKPRWQDIDQWEPVDPAGHVVKFWHVLTRLNDRNNKVSQLPQCLSNVRAIASNNSIHTRNNKFNLWHTKMSFVLKDKKEDVQTVKKMSKMEMCSKFATDVFSKIFLLINN